MKVQVYDNLDQPYPSIAFYSKKGKVVLNFARQTLVISEKVFGKSQERSKSFYWRTVLEKKFK